MQNLCFYYEYECRFTQVSFQTLIQNAIYCSSLFCGEIKARTFSLFFPDTLKIFGFNSMQWNASISFVIYSIILLLAPRSALFGEEKERERLNCQFLPVEASSNQLNSALRSRKYSSGPVPNWVSKEAVMRGRGSYCHWGKIFLERPDVHGTMVLGKYFESPFCSLSPMV